MEPFADLHDPSQIPNRLSRLLPELLHNGGEREDKSHGQPAEHSEHRIVGLLLT